ncbi:hypothetical protein D3C83_184520 [compost metagenome]
MSTYSAQLIRSLQRYFAEQYRVDLTNQQASEYLDTLADLYLTASGRSIGAPFRRADTTLVGLDISNT